MQPDFGGHSREDVFVLNLMGSKSPSIAHAEINFPLGCLNVPNSKKFPATTMPVSVENLVRVDAATKSAKLAYDRADPICAGHHPGVVLQVEKPA